jgi:tryptophan synthase alpha chain
MGHVIADYPSPDAVRAMIETMVVAGAKVIEIQIPFSEPMADGPLFLAANHRAIAQGVDYKAALQLMGEVSRTYPQVRFLFMSYLNVIFKRGYKK